MSDSHAEDGGANSRGESVMQKAFIRHRLISAALDWYNAGCPEANADGDGPRGELEDAIHEYIDHEQQVKARAEQRKLREPSNMKEKTRHASQMEDSQFSLCGERVGKRGLTEPKDVVNCPTCRAILNHVRQQYPQHAEYADWRLTKEQMSEAARDMARDLLGVG